MTTLANQEREEYEARIAEAELGAGQAEKAEGDAAAEAEASAVSLMQGTCTKLCASGLDTTVTAAIKADSTIERACCFSCRC